MNERGREGGGERETERIQCDMRYIKQIRKQQQNRKAEWKILKPRQAKGTQRKEMLVFCSSYIFTTPLNAFRQQNFGQLIFFQTNSHSNKFDSDLISTVGSALKKIVKEGRIESKREKEIKRVRERGIEREQEKEWVIYE